VKRRERERERERERKKEVTTEEKGVERIYKQGKDRRKVKHTRYTCIMTCKPILPPNNKSKKIQFSFDLIMKVN
jgi:hypothetical protein